MEKKDESNEKRMKAKNSVKCYNAVAGFSN